MRTQITRRGRSKGPLFWNPSVCLFPSSWVLETVSTNRNLSILRKERTGCPLGDRVTHRKTMVSDGPRDFSAAGPLTSAKGNG